jgi:hypothetical protein
MQYLLWQVLCKYPSVFVSDFMLVGGCILTGCFMIRGRGCGQKHWHTTANIRSET